LPYASKDTIYRFIKSVYGRTVEAHRKKKSRRRKKRGKSSKLEGRVFIDKRPKTIDNRAQAGHTEADFVVSGKSGKGVLLVVVCRKLRVAFIEQIIETTLKNVHRAFKRIKKRFPEMKTITSDNDILLQKHKELEKEIKVKIYFCHPYSSWEKGSVENVNMHIRKSIPKGSDISKYSKSFIKKVEDKVNSRILECLDFLTPSEALEKHRQTKKRSRVSLKS
jgi:IS30 family transposase